MKLYGSLVASEGGNSGGGGATVEVPIKTISVNGVNQPPLNKRVNINVPTKISELENDSNFASKDNIPTKISELTNDSNLITSDDLAAKNYVDKTYVNEKLADVSGVGGVKRKVVDVLPESNEADNNTVYMIKDDTVTGDNKYKDYMLIDGTLICIGDTSVDLTGYLKSTDVVDSISEFNTDKPLSANQGRVLSERYDNLSNDVHYLDDELNKCVRREELHKTLKGDSYKRFELVPSINLDHENPDLEDDVIYMVQDNTVNGVNKFRLYAKLGIDKKLHCISDTSIEVPIKSISVNGVEVAPDENNNVNIRISGEGGTGGASTAEDTSYNNANYPDYTNVDLALDALFNKVYYVKPTCSLSASPSGGTFEMGTVISAPITFNWNTNKDIKSQTLTGCTIADASVRTATYNTNVTSDKTFTLSVSDGENSASSSVSYKFLNKVFWGSSPTAETYDSAFINALSNKKLASSVKGTYSFNVKSGEYGFFAVPSSMTISSVWIGGFEVTVDSVGTVSYTNSKGYTRDYNLYKTGKSGLGSISAEIK